MDKQASNRRSRLNRTDRRVGINAAAWFAGQSFTSAHRGDMPLTSMSVAQLDQAGAGLLPEPDETPHCIYCGVACFESQALI